MLPMIDQAGAPPEHAASPEALFPPLVVGVEACQDGLVYWWHNLLHKFQTSRQYASTLLYLACRQWDVHGRHSKASIRLNICTCCQVTGAHCQQNTVQLAAGTCCASAPTVTLSTTKDTRTSSLHGEKFSVDSQLAS
jgi:hypothetical protein